MDLNEYSEIQHDEIVDQWIACPCGNVASIRNLYTQAGRAVCDLYINGGTT